MPDYGLLLTLRHLTRLLLVSKETTATDAQRLLRQAMPGAEPLCQVESRRVALRLVLAELSSVSTVPSFFLAGRLRISLQSFSRPNQWISMGFRGIIRSSAALRSARERRKWPIWRLGPESPEDEAV